MEELNWIWNTVSKGPENLTLLIKMIYPEIPNTLAGALGYGGFVWLAIKAFEIGYKK